MTPRRPAKGGPSNAPTPEAPLASGVAFDAAYYQRFYGSRRTRVQGPADVARLCRFVLASAAVLRIDVERVAEVGAGVGLWRDWFARHQPGVRYTSTEYSAYACRTYGHRRLDIAEKPLRGRFDVVVCQGVLPYLDDAAAKRALGNLAAMTGQLLYLECQTSRDIAVVLDQEVSDPALRGRPVAFYAEPLDRELVHLGLNLWARRELASGLYQLESGSLTWR